MRVRYNEVIQICPTGIHIAAHSQNGLYDITRQVEAIVSESGVQTGLVNVYAKGATSAIMIEFNMMYP